MNANHPASPRADDDRHRRAVALLLLRLHPAALTEDEVVREIADDDTFAARDAVVQAMRDLRAAGVLHRHGRFVTPTRSAVVTAELLEAW